MTVFQTKEWESLWAGEVVEGGKFVDQGEQVIFASMAKIEGHRLTDYGGIAALGDEEKMWQKIIDRFAGKTLVLDYIREDSLSFQILKNLGSERKQWVAPYLDLPGSFDEYLDSLGRKNRHELRRKMKKTPGELRVEDGGRGADNLIRLMKLSSKEKNQFMTAGMENWFRKMMQVMNKYIKILAVEDKAAYLGFVWENESYLYNGGYDPNGGYAAGMAAHGKIIEWAIKNKYKKVDYLRGDERYKYDLGAKDQQLYQLTIAD